jgi:transcription initiation factor IIE alpha subunit
MKARLAEWYYEGGRLPRKIKKRILGIKISSCKLKRMLKETVVGKPIRTMYERVEFTPYGEFCPKCGEKSYIGMGSRAEYPEHWEYFKCIRCRSTVGYIDNSPFIHALECAHNNYDPVF